MRTGINGMSLKNLFESKGYDLIFGVAYEKLHNPMYSKHLTT